MDIQRQTFKRGSKTYFNSSLFFPKAVRRDVFALYGFVRVADDFVDAVPQDGDGFRAFEREYRRALGGRESDDVIISSFVELVRRKELETGWVDAFLRSMEMDLEKSTYHSLDETLEYIYGSAEVIGLFMARIMDLPGESFSYARLLGRAMQYINFIRDIAEDRSLGRTYLPLAEGELSSLDREEADRHPEAFKRFIAHQLERYRAWQREAEAGFRFIPKRYLIPIKTASDMYGWTARKIEADPFVVYRRKVKPRRGRIILRVVRNALLLPAPSL